MIELWQNFKNMVQELESKVEIIEDFLPIKGTAYIEFYVGNAKQSAYYYEKTFGFEIIGYKGPETGHKDIASYVLKQGKVRLVLTASLVTNSVISKHVATHGDGVKTLALVVDDVYDAYFQTTSRGAVSVLEPTVISDEDGEVVMATFKTYGDTVHTLVDASNYKGVFMPGYKAKSTGWFSKTAGIEYVDHCVGNVHLGDMDKWVAFYEEVMGFKLLLTFDDKDISTKYTALMSKVVSNGNGFIKFPINEPAAGIKKSQVEEYLDFYNGAGVQHIAMATNDICATISELRSRGVEFLYVPDTYYEDIKDRVGHIQEDFELIKKLNILVDRDEEGYLLQIFTKPVEDRPTLFFEIIQRRGAQSFGKGNFQALFEALEREQELRGNL